MCFGFLHSWKKFRDYKKLLTSCHDWKNSVIFLFLSWNSFLISRKQTKMRSSAFCTLNVWVSKCLSRLLKRNTFPSLCVFDWISDHPLMTAFGDLHSIFSCINTIKVNEQLSAAYFECSRHVVTSRGHSALSLRTTSNL